MKTTQKEVIVKAKDEKDAIRKAYKVFSIIQDKNTLQQKTIYIVNIRAQFISGNTDSWAKWNDWFEYKVAATSIREARKIGILAGEDNNDFKRTQIIGSDVQERDTIWSL